MGCRHADAACVRDGNKMNETADKEFLGREQGSAAVKYAVLALCLALFVVYGIYMA